MFFCFILKIISIILSFISFFDHGTYLHIVQHLPTLTIKLYKMHGIYMWLISYAAAAQKNYEEVSWDRDQASKVLERVAWAGSGGYTKVSQPTPWLLSRSKH